MTQPITLPDDCSVIDSTKLKSFVACERQFMFNYLFGWLPTSTYSAFHLAFGISIHEALASLYTDWDIVAASVAFADAHQKYITDANLSPPATCSKTLEQGLIALQLYAKEHAYWANGLQVLRNEVAGEFKILPDLPPLTWRMDKIVQTHEGIQCIEHKTASSEPCDNWFIEIQPNVYLSALKEQFPEATLQLDFLIFPSRSKQIKFARKPIKEVNSIAIYSVREHYKLLWTKLNWTKQHLESGDIKGANEEWLCSPCSCGSYYGCPYLQFCKVERNPWEDYAYTPDGFIRTVWNPLKEAFEKGIYAVTLNTVKANSNVDNFLFFN